MFLQLTRFFPLIFLIGVASSAFAQFDDPRADLVWSRIETEHFNVVYHAGTERTARLTAKIAEEIYGPITSLYAHTPDQKVNFVIKDIADYSNGETNYYTNTIVIWANALDFDMRGTHNWLRNVISHEFTHDVEIQTAMKFARRVPTIAFQYLGYENERRQDVLTGFPNRIFTIPVSGSVVPAWFAEGVAQYMRPEFGYESWDAHRDMILRMAMLDSTLLSWNEMSTFGKTSFGDESSYNTGFALIRYIGEKYGELAVREISYNLATVNRMTIDGAIERTIGITGAQLYEDWHKALRAEYVERIAPVQQHLIIGDTVGKIGFGNFHAQFSADGKTILYVSNKTSDYFSGAAFLCDPVTKTDTAIVPVSGRAVFTPDGKHILYARRSRPDTRHTSFFNLHYFNRKTEEDKIIPNTTRAHSPNITPDGTHVVFVKDSDGTENMFMMEEPFSEHPSIHAITAFGSSEQVYNPVFTRDGKSVVFDYSPRDHRGIAVMNIDGSGMRTVIAGVHDYRSAAFSPDGRTICFACDSNGIYNIYRGKWDEASKSIVAGSVVQVTNVPGGAFYPAIDSIGDIAYSLFTSGGYKLAYLRSPNAKPVPPDTSTTPGGLTAASKSRVIPSATPTFDPAPYFYKPYSPMPASMHVENAVLTNHAPRTTGNFDWPALRAYDDTKTPEYSSTPYKDIFTTLFVIPILRVDTYNKFNSGFQHVKIGAIFTSSDVTDRLGILAGAMTNDRFEYDLFASLTFHDRIPLLWTLGINPLLTLSIYNSQHLSSGTIPVLKNVGTRVVDTMLNLGVTYNLLSFDITAATPIFNAAHILQFGFNHTRYNTALDPFINPQNQQYVALPSDLALYTTTLSIGYAFTAIAPTRTEEINPVGRDIHFMAGQEWNYVEDTVVVGDGGLPKRIYAPYDYLRLGLLWHEHFALPFWSHTLSFGVRAEGMIGGGVSAFNERAHALFDTYIGGMYGMQGYPFYGIGGTRTYAIKATYRFPISTNLDWRLGGIYFDKIFLGVFADYGSAWDGAVRDAFKTPRRDVGAEFRLDAFLWYNIPLKFFFNAAYGLDEFKRTFRTANDDLKGDEVTYGRQWLFYAGMGFDFPE